MLSAEKTTSSNDVLKNAMSDLGLLIFDARSCRRFQDLGEINGENVGTVSGTPPNISSQFQTVLFSFANFDTSQKSKATTPRPLDKAC